MEVVGPSPAKERYPLGEDILANLKSGLTVGLVNLPLSVSLAIACGATPEMGALSAAWGGIVGGLLNGSHFSLIAPTGGLSGVLGNYAEQYGVMCLPILALFTSCISALAWALDLHHFLTIIPSCGMVGFKLGIGTIIALNQLNFALGLNPDAISGWKRHEHFYERVYESLKHAGHTKPWNPVIFLLNMIPLIYLLKFGPKKLRLFPWHMVFVALGIVYGYVLDANDNPMDLLLLKERFEINPYLVGFSTNVSATDPAFFSGVDTAQFSWSGVFIASFSVSIIAILETQIAAKILDDLTSTAFDSKREVLGTAATNLVAGLAGGLPICGAMARMTLNANCGARSRTSIVINGFTVLIIMFALMPLFRFVPQPVIGAVLVPVAIGMIKPSVYLHYWRVDKPSLLITFITWAVCVFLDPTYAIFVAILFGLLRAARNEGFVAPARWTSINKMGAPVDLRLYTPIGKWDYTNSVRHMGRIAEARKSGHPIAVSMHDVFLVDVDGVDALKSLLASKISVVGLQEAPRAQCAKTKWFDKVVSDGLVLESVNDLISKQMGGSRRPSIDRTESSRMGTPPSDEEAGWAVVDANNDEFGSPASGSPPSTASPAAAPPAGIVSEKEVLQAQERWASAITTISRVYREGGDYVQAASSAASELYGYGHSAVLFKPTKAALYPFRPTGNEAMSYFVGGNAVDDGYDEDAGFAINGGKGWSHVEFDNHQLDFNGSTAVAMGTYWFTCATTGSKTKVEYSFGYKKNADGKVRIFLHHSSVPYAVTAAPAPDKPVSRAGSSKMKIRSSTSSAKILPAAPVVPSDGKNVSSDRVSALMQVQDQRFAKY